MSNMADTTNFSGTKCYTDAAIATDPQRYNPRQAGLGIFIQGSTGSAYKSILIQAVTGSALDALQAEAHAMTLASEINRALQIEQICYLTDSKLLATNLQKEDPVTHAADWRLRHLLADFVSNSTECDFTCHKIPRKRNTMAHTLAAQARHQGLQETCLFVCNNPAHPSDCPVKLALQNLQCGSSCLISVSCI
ncbi:unnamed protein product [Urochloa humidicola]